MKVEKPIQKQKGTMIGGVLKEQRPTFSTPKIKIVTAPKTPKK